VRFLRHLAAVCLVVAVVVALGLAWNHFAGSTLAGGLTGPRQELVSGAGHGRGHIVLPPGAQRPGGPHGPVIIRVGKFDLGLNSMLQRVNWPYLRHTVTIETLFIAAVVIIDASRRRARRASRAAEFAPARGSDNPNEQHE
jgi:hypothetical protein